MTSRDPETLCRESKITSTAWDCRAAPTYMVIRWVFTCFCQFGFVWKQRTSNLKWFIIVAATKMTIWGSTGMHHFHSFIRACMHACRRRRTHTHPFSLRSIDLHVCMIFLAASSTPGPYEHPAQGQSLPAGSLRGRYAGGQGLAEKYPIRRIVLQFTHIYIYTFFFCIKLCVYLRIYIYKFIYLQFLFMDH